MDFEYNEEEPEEEPWTGFDEPWGNDDEESDNWE